MRVSILRVVMTLVCLAATALAIADTASANVPEPSVEGWVIAWADDGWYQVQTADGSETLCEDGTSCDVKAEDGDKGDYKVINHSTSPKQIWMVSVPALGGSTQPPAEPPKESSGGDGSHLGEFAAEHMELRFNNKIVCHVYRTLRETKPKAQGCPTHAGDYREILWNTGSDGSWKEVSRRTVTMTGYNEPERQPDPPSGGDGSHLGEFAAEHMELRFNNKIVCHVYRTLRETKPKAQGCPTHAGDYREILWNTGSDGTWKEVSRRTVTMTGYNEPERQPDPPSGGTPSPGSESSDSKVWLVTHKTPSENSAFWVQPSENLYGWIPASCDLRAQVKTQIDGRQVTWNDITGRGTFTKGPDFTCSHLKLRIQHATAPRQPAPFAFENTIVSRSAGELVVRMPETSFVGALLVCRIPAGAGNSCNAEQGGFTVYNAATGQKFPIRVTGKEALNGDKSGIVKQIETNIFNDLSGNESPARPGFVYNELGGGGRMTVATPGGSVAVGAKVNGDVATIDMRYPNGDSMSVSVDLTTGKITGRGPSGERIEGSVTSVDPSTGTYRTVIRVDGKIVYDIVDQLSGPSKPTTSCPFDWCADPARLVPGSNSSSSNNDSSSLNPYETVLPDGSNDKDGDGTPDAIDVDPNDANRNGIDRNRNGIVDSQENASVSTGGDGSGTEWKPPVVVGTCNDHGCSPA